MNPLTRLRNWIIGDAMAATDDVFEKARILLLYNFTMFFFVLGVTYYGNLIANHLTLQIWITTVGVVNLPVGLAVLKKTKRVRYAGIVFVLGQTLLGVLNTIIRNFELSVAGVFWALLLVILTFFILDLRWGIAFAVYTGAMFFICILNSQKHLIHFDIPKDQVPADSAFFIFMPYSLIVYAVYQMTKTRKKAEDELDRNKRQLENNNRQLESKNKDITDSINYAQRIQYAVLPNEDAIYRSIPLSFILYKPKNIVSGDFFWFHEIDRDNYILVTADCTGHGVPGALMTVIGSSLLNQVIIENRIHSPAQILQEVDKRITETLKQQKTHQYFVQDGMDLALIKVDKAKKEFVFTSAKRPAVFIRNGEMQEIKGSKFSLGGMRTGEKIFEEVQMNFREDDIIYFFTDGYADQFGGEKGKKFSNKRLRETIHSLHRLPMNEQKQKFDHVIESWRGTLEQVDDVCVIGVRF